MTLAPPTFESLATDLCSAIPPIPYKGDGRPPSSEADVVFVGICRLDRSFHKKARGSIPGHVHSNVVLRRQSTPETLEILPLLLHESSRSLVSPERMALQALYVKNWKRLYQEGELPYKRGGVDQSTAIEVKYDSETNLITEIRFVQEVSVGLLGEDHPIAQGMSGRSGAKQPPGVRAEIYLKAIGHNLRTIVKLGKPVVFWGGKTPAQHQTAQHQAPKATEDKGLAALLVPKLKLVNEAQNKIGFIMSEFDTIPRADQINLVVQFILKMIPSPSPFHLKKPRVSEIEHGAPQKVPSPKEAALKKIILDTPPPSTAPKAAPKAKTKTESLNCGKRIRKARLKAGLSQSALGGLMGYKQSSIADIEAGRYASSKKRFNEFLTAIENTKTSHSQAQPVPPSGNEAKEPAAEAVPPEPDDVMQAARDILGL